MVSAQGECSIPEAFDLLRERSLALRQTLDFTAVDVIEGRLRFGG